MKEIVLSGGFVALVDDEDFDNLNKYKWHIQKSKYVNYARRTENGKPVLMHRFIMGVTDPKILVDHRKGDGLNNQRSNLRIATRSQNNTNRLRYKNLTSKYRGVSWSNQNGDWRAQIRLNTKKINLGGFEKEEDAARAYNEAAIKYHGDFAITNNL
jgi:hypothetical protein